MFRLMHRDCYLRGRRSFFFQISKLRSIWQTFPPTSTSFPSSRISYYVDILTESQTAQRTGSLRGFFSQIQQESHKCSWTSGASRRAVYVKNKCVIQQLLETEPIGKIRSRHQRTSCTLVCIYLHIFSIYVKHKIIAHLRRRCLEWRIAG